MVFVCDTYRQMYTTKPQTAILTQWYASMVSTKIVHVPLDNTCEFPMYMDVHAVFHMYI